MKNVSRLAAIAMPIVAVTHRLKKPKNRLRCGDSSRYPIAYTVVTNQRIADSVTKSSER